MTDETTAFIAIDVQNDFCPGGALAVAEGDRVVPLINRLMPDFPVRVLTQDWHPAGHFSFASSNEGGEPFGVTEAPYGPQVLWPDHCVIGTDGAAFHADLATDSADLIVRKGYRLHIDSYSAFFENDHRTPTGLDGYLRTRGVDKLVMAGLATDFVFGSLRSMPRNWGTGVTVLEDACRAIDLDGSLAAARDEMRACGVELTTSDAM